MSAGKLLKIRLSLKGRPIRAYVFDQECVLVGRNPDADIFLDNSGISRDHLKIERTPQGYMVEDLNSGNGTFVNDRQVQREYLAHEDVVRIGKFSLWVSLEEDRRGNTARVATSPVALEGTTILRTQELDEMMHTVRETDKEPPPEPVGVAASTQAERKRWRARTVLFSLSAFLSGTALGAGTVYYLLWIVMH
jgi:predicted component of type VI protein secretion system